jgi:hypothetical protein
MIGTEVLEEILGLLEEGKRERIEVFREVIASRGYPRVRRVLKAGTVLGVLDFEAVDIGYEDLVGKRVSGVKERGPISEFADNPVHLYRLVERLRANAQDPVVFQDDSQIRGWESGVFHASRAFDSVCRDFDYRFTSGLKPVVKYSIVSPALTVEFPVCHGWRGDSYGNPRVTSGTGIIHTPFLLTPNKNLRELQEYFERGQEAAPEESLRNAGFYFQQAARVVKAIEGSKNFQGFANNFVELSRQIDEKQQQEYRAGIGRQ